MWNIVITIICVVALLFNSYLWNIYLKRTTKENREKDGWNSYYVMTTILLVIVLLTRISKL